MKRIETLLPFVYFEEEIRPKEQACVSLGAHSLQYGTSCFGGIRAYYKEGALRLFRLREHFDRLLNGAKILGFGFHMEYDLFHDTIMALARANKIDTDIYIRPFIFSNDEFLPPRLPGLTFQLAIYMNSFDVYFPHEKGLRMMISSWRKIPDNVISTKAKAGGAYLNAALATTEAMNAGYDEALVCDENGYIVEASVANMIMVYRNEIIVPSLGSPLLEGITMRTMLELLKDAGYTIRVENIDRSMVYTCDELLLTGTAAQVIHAQSVDGRVIGDGKVGPVGKMLRSSYQQILDGEHPWHKDWVELLHL